MTLPDKRVLTLKYVGISGISRHSGGGELNTRYLLQSYIRDFEVQSPRTKEIAVFPTYVVAIY